MSADSSTGEIQARRNAQASRRRLKSCASFVIRSLRSHLPRSLRASVLQLPSARRSFSCVCLCAAVVGMWFMWRASSEDGSRVNAARSVEEIDRELQRAATLALGTREGTIILMDAQTGRLRVVVGERIAYTEARAPGSTVKPFTLLAALRSGLIDDETRTLCPGLYQHDDFEIRCSHPRFKPPFNPTQALAHSCNFYFSKLGERLDAQTFNPLLASFGFGARTGATLEAEEEATGLLPRDRWRASNALGEGHELLVTPVQLVTAYAALANGGHLLRPYRTAAIAHTDDHDDTNATRERRRIRLAPAHRRLILAGMRGAVAYGTAARAGLDSLPVYVFGKTGTSTPTDALANDGWFVGFASDAGGDDADVASPESVRLVVLVFLKRASGADSAEVARPVLETYARANASDAGDVDARDTRQQEGATTTEREADAARDSTHASHEEVRVRVQGAGAGRVLRMPVDAYLFGVLAAEASVEDEPEAFKAQAVVSRTFARKNMRRHARDGYDFCSSTHCQRYVAVGDESVRAEFYAAVRRAIAQTRGEILRDAGGGVAEAYFSASCGGTTADIKTLWGATNAAAHLRGVRDPFCAAMPHRSWTDTIPSERLAAALAQDPRSDTGGRLERVSVVRRDATGRVETLLVEGERRRILSGWDFKIIVGRALGWSVLKSSRFEVARAGKNFIFRGGGFGHGLGLCQSGAHTLAHRGASYRHILNHYLPGTTLHTHSAKSLRTHPTASTPSVHARQTTNFEPPLLSLRQPMIQRLTMQRASLQRPMKQRLSLSGEGVRVSYPAGVARRDVERAVRVIEGVRADVRLRLAASSLSPDVAPPVEVLMYGTTGDFTGATGQPHWVAATTRGRRIEMQPPAALLRRQVFDTTLKHEYVHAVVEALGRGRAPLWLAEGLAIHVAGESRRLARDASPVVISRAEIERRLAARPSSPEEMRALFRAAHREVSALIRAGGESSVWLLVARG